MNDGCVNSEYTLPGCRLMALIELSLIDTEGNLTFENCRLPWAEDVFVVASGSGTEVPLYHLVVLTHTIVRIMDAARAA